MKTGATNRQAKSNWFVGARFHGKEDQTPRFLAEGVWEAEDEDQRSDAVRSMRPEDRIAIKSTYTRKHNLPFDNRGLVVSVMAIKAIGTIIENLNDGKRVRVSWTKEDPVREWYFYTNQKTVWRVLPGDWETDGLIAFAFDHKAQDIHRFSNAPYWRERFGSSTPDKQRFKWTAFYEAVADKLLSYRSNRSALVDAIREISLRVEGLGYLADDHYADGTTGFVKDICPFTTMGMFNRHLTVSNRKIIAAELARFLGVNEALPETFEGIPVLNNLRSWYFPWEADRPVDHMNSLWDVFDAAIKFADGREGEDALDAFATAFDNVSGRPQVGWNLTMGLYWIRPWSLLSSRQQLTDLYH